MRLLLVVVERHAMRHIMAIQQIDQDTKIRDDNLVQSKFEKLDPQISNDFTAHAVVNLDSANIEIDSSVTLTDVARAVKNEANRLGKAILFAYERVISSSEKFIVGSTTRIYRDKAQLIDNEVNTRLPIIKDKFKLDEDNPTYDKLNNQLKWAVSLLSEMIARRHLSRNLDLDTINEDQRAKLAEIIGCNLNDLEHTHNSVNKTDNAQRDCERYLAWLQQVKFRFDFTVLALGQTALGSPLLFRPGKNVPAPMPTTNSPNATPRKAPVEEPIARVSPGPAL
jgi:hypothetical protein